MNLGIYKPGQGYWVRVMTAVFAGVIVLAAAAWLWGEMAAVSLPVHRWRESLTVLDGNTPVGERVSLVMRSGPGGGTEQVIGSALVSDWELRTTNDGVALITDATMEQIAPGRSYDPTQAEYLRAEGFLAQVSGAQGIPIFEQIYLQAIGAGVMLLGGAALLYWIVGASRKSSDFLIATDGEMKKVNWSTRKQIIGSTWVVIGACFLLAALLFVVDLGFSRFFKLIQVLE